MMIETDDKGVVVIGNFGKDTVFEDAVKLVEESAEEILEGAKETRAEGKARLIAQLEELAGGALGKNRKALRDRKNDAHFKAKDRL